MEISADRDRQRPSRISRRTLLRFAVLGGSGLLAAHVLGCGDGEGDAAPTATIAPAEPSPTEPVVSSPSPQALRWERLSAPDPLPPPRRDHSLVTTGRRLYVFGGKSAEELNDLWSYDLEAGAWFRVGVEGGPAPRLGHNAVWDANQARLVVFGGQQGNTFFNDTWAFDPEAGSWSELPSGNRTPAARYGAGAALGGEDSLLVTHGFTFEGRFDDTWQLDLATDGWTEVSPAASRPLERCLLRAVWDSRSDRLLLFGGQATGAPFLGDLWALSVDGWAEISADGAPSPRNLYAMAFDEESLRAVLFGGNTADGPVNDLHFFEAATDTWRRASPDNDGPSPRFGHDAVWLPDRRALAVFGGNDGAEDLNDLWLLSVPA